MYKNISLLLVVSVSVFSCQAVHGGCAKTKQKVNDTLEGVRQLDEDPIEVEFIARIQDRIASRNLRAADAMVDSAIFQHEFAKIKAKNDEKKNKKKAEGKNKKPVTKAEEEAADAVMAALIAEEEEKARAKFSKKQGKKKQSKKGKK